MKVWEPRVGGYCWRVDGHLVTFSGTCAGKPVAARFRIERVSESSFWLALGFGQTKMCRRGAQTPWAWPTEEEAQESYRERAIWHCRHTMRRLAKARKKLEGLGISISEVEFLELTGAKSNEKVARTLRKFE